MLLIVLVLANVVAAVFTWQAVTASPAPPPASELSPERIKIISGDEARKLSTKDGPRSCIEWGAFALADVARASKALEALQAGLRYTERRIEPVLSFWVHVPPQANRRAAETLLAGLRRIGGDDYYVVVDDPRFTNAISLGLFNNEAGAAARREALIKQGIRDVAVATRELSAGRVFLQIRDIPAQAMARLVTLRADFNGSDLKDCVTASAKG